MGAGISEAIMSETNQRLARQRAMSVQEFCRTYGIGRTRAYEELKASRLRGRKAGNRTIITVDDAEDWLLRLPTVLTLAATK